MSHKHIICKPGSLLEITRPIWQPSRTLQHETSATAPHSTFRFCFIIHLLGRFQRTPLKSFSSINRTTGSDTSNIARHLRPIPLRISSFAHHEIFLLQAYSVSKSRIFPSESDNQPYFFLLEKSSR